MYTIDNTKHYKIIIQNHYKTSDNTPLLKPFLYFCGIFFISTILYMYIDEVSIFLLKSIRENVQMLTKEKLRY